MSTSAITPSDSDIEVRDQPSSGLASLAQPSPVPTQSPDQNPSDLPASNLGQAVNTQQQPLKGLGGRLRGVLYGLAIGGVPGAVGGAIAPNTAQQSFQRRQDVANARRDTAQAQAQAAIQNVQFESVKAADSHILAMKQAQNYDAASQVARAQVRQLNDAHQKFLTDEYGILPDLTIEGNGQEVQDQATGGLGTLAGQNGGQIPPVSVNIQPHTDTDPQFKIGVYAPSQQSLTQNQQGYRQIVNDARAVQGLPPIDDLSWNTQGFKGQRQMAQGAMEFLAPAQSFNKDNIGAMLAQRQQMLENYEKHVDQNGQPDAKPSIISQLRQSVDYLKKAKEDINAENIKTQVDTKNALAATPTGRLETAKNQAELTKTQQEIAKNNEEPGVAYDPNYQNPDGTKGANVVTSRGKAREQGLQFYKEDPATINSTVGGMNDVQNKLNQLAAITTDPNTVGKINGPLAAALLDAKGLQVDAHGIHIPFERMNAGMFQENLAKANPETRAYVVAMLGAHEAMTQLPRLQTFGKSNRMTERQMEAAQALLPMPGGDADMMRRQMQSIQTMIDPLRRQVPHMAGAELIPSWAESGVGGGETNTYQGHTYTKQQDGSWKLTQ